MGNDFSKIRAASITRLSLSSSSVDEVIQRRVLEKTAPTADMLAQVYEQDAAVLKTTLPLRVARAPTLPATPTPKICGQLPVCGLPV